MMMNSEMEGGCLGVLDSELGGAMLLFAINLMSILVVGVFFMYFYKVHLLPRRQRAQSCGLITLTIFILLCLMSIPLGYTSFLIQ